MNKSLKPQLTLAMAALVVTAVFLPSNARAHCDAIDGPVVADARAALAAGEATPVLKWIAQEDEATVERVFEHVLKVRGTGEAARDLADRYFFETVVRLHRAFEGAPYTGLKPAGTDPGPAVRAADSALEQGSVDELVAAVVRHVEEGIRQRFADANAGKAHKDHSVEAGRRYVAAYVEFVHYVLNLHNAAAGHGGHAEGGVADDSGHAH